MQKRPAASPYGGPPAKAPRPDIGTTREAVLRYERRGLLDASKLDDAVLAELHRLGRDGVARALEKFSHYDLPSVGDHSALLKDVIAAERGAAASRPTTTKEETNSNGANNVLMDYHKAGLLDINLFDAPARRDFEALPSAEAEQVMRVYFESDRSRVTNHSSFLKSLIRMAKQIPDFAQTGWELDLTVTEKLDQAIAEGCIAPEECDAQLRVALKTLTPQEALRALESFISQIKADPDAVHNRPAFLAGMLKRFRQAAEFANQNSKPVPELVEEYVARGQVAREVVQPCLSELEMLPPGMAGQALEEFAHVDLTGIPNPTGCLRGIIRKVLRQGPSAVPGPVPVPRQPIVPVNPRPERAYPAQSGRAPPPPRAVATRPPAAAAARPPPAVPAPAAAAVARPELDTAILDLLARHRDAGRIRDGDLDRGCVVELQRLGLALAQQVLADFFQNDLDAIRNKSSFLIGLIKRAKVITAPAAPPPRGPYSGGFNSQPRPPPVTAVPPPPARPTPRPAYPNLPAPPRYADVAPPHPRPPPPMGRVGTPYSAPPPTGQRYAEPRAPIAGRGRADWGPAPNGPAYGSRPAPAPAVVEEKVFCPQCGVQQPTVNFCIKCGFALNQFLAGVAGGR